MTKSERSVNDLGELGVNDLDESPDPNPALVRGARSYKRYSLCTCMTKTPEPEYHAESCTYRRAEEDRANKFGNRFLLQQFDAAYFAACATSEPEDWLKAVMLARQWRNSVVGNHGRTDVVPDDLDDDEDEDSDA